MGDELRRANSNREWADARVRANRIGPPRIALEQPERRRSRAHGDHVGTAGAALISTVNWGTSQTRRDQRR
jgi:hypothetical protein